MLNRKMAHAMYATQLPALLASKERYQKVYDWSVKYYEDMPDNSSVEEKLARLMHVKSVAEARNLISVEYANVKINEAASSSRFDQQVRADETNRELTPMLEGAREQANFWVQTYNSFSKPILTPIANIDPEKIMAEGERIFELMGKELGL